MKPINRDKKLLVAIDTLLSAAPEGLRELELIDQLDQQYPEVFPKPDLSDTWLLFQHHFVLRHHVYSLQRSLLDDKKANIEIDPVSIKKTLYHEAHSYSVSEHDPVREYYLDFTNLYEESESSVDALLNDFWVSLARYHAKPEALETLGLTGNESQAEQKKHYKRLVQAHHPDKGGDPKVFQEIQTAWSQIHSSTNKKKPLD